MIGKVRTSNTAEGIVLLLAIIMMGIGAIGLVMFIMGTPVPFYRDAIVPGWAVNALIHSWALFIGLAGIWLYKTTGSFFVARVTIEELREQNRFLQRGVGVRKNVIEQ